MQHLCPEVHLAQLQMTKDKQVRRHQTQNCNNMLQQQDFKFLNHCIQKEIFSQYLYVQVNYLCDVYGRPVRPKQNWKQMLQIELLFVDQKEC